MASRWIRVRSVTIPRPLSSSGSRMRALFAAKRLGNPSASGVLFISEAPEGGPPGGENKSRFRRKGQAEFHRERRSDGGGKGEASSRRRVVVTGSDPPGDNPAIRRQSTVHPRRNLVDPGRRPVQISPHDPVPFLPVIEEGDVLRRTLSAPRGPRSGGPGCQGIRSRGGCEGGGGPPDRHTSAHFRRGARRRRIFFGGRNKAGFPERARGGQSLLPDLSARSRDRRHGADLSRQRQDDLRLGPPGREARHVRLDPRESRGGGQQKAEYAERESGTARKYSWDYDAEFDIYETVPGSGEYKNLTKTEGYDAEGAWSPDGKKLSSPRTARLMTAR